MNADQLKGKCMTFTGDLKSQYGKCTNDDLQQIKDNYDTFVGKIQEQYGDKQAKLDEGGGPIDSEVRAWRHEEQEGSFMKTLRKHILVVDDDPVLRALYQALLENYGYTSDTVENGEEVETKLAQAIYDAVLLDYMMPGPNGMSVLHRIQQRYPSLPVVMMTGESHRQVASQAPAAGARACLYKPVDCKEFEEVLRSTVGTAPLRSVMSEHMASTS